MSTLKQEPSDIDSLRERAQNLREQLKVLDSANHEGNEKIKRMRAYVAGLGTLMLLLMGGFLYMTSNAYSDYMHLKHKNDLLNSRLNETSSAELAVLLARIERERLPEKKNHRPRILNGKDLELSVEGQVIKVVATLLQAESVQLTDHLGNDLGANPLQVFELILAVEWDCYTTLDSADIEALETVQDLVDAVKSGQYDQSNE